MKKLFKSTPFKIAAIYFISAGLYIIFSDYVISLFISDPNQLINIQTYKGLGFVLITSLLLFFSLLKNMKKLNDETKKAAAAQKALVEREKYYFNLMLYSPFAKFVSKDGVIIDLNKACVELLGAEGPEQIIGKKSREIFHPDYRAQNLERSENLKEIGESIKSIKEKIIRLDGTFIDVEVSASLFPYQNETAFHVVLRDITPLVATQNELIERNDFISTIMENLPIGVAVNFIDVGIATYINPAFERIYGWPKEALWDIDQYFIKVYPDEAYRNKIKARVIDDIQSGDPSRMTWEELEITTREGEKRFVSAKNIPIFEQNLMVSTVWDVTDIVVRERKLIEARTRLEELAEYLQWAREDERKRIARDLHDDLGQLLTAIKIDLNNIQKLSKSISEDVHQQITTTIGMIDNAISFTQDLTSELRPGILDDLGLVPAVQYYLEKISHRLDVDTHFSINPDNELVLSQDKLTHLYRIFQEGLTNIARHANATEIDVLIEHSDERIKLCIKDNGVGIKLVEQLHRQSYGLIGMQERVRVMNGEMSIEGVPGEGTMLTISVPL